MGHALNDLVGQPHRVLVPRDDMDDDAYAQFWVRLRTGEPVSGLFRRWRADGQPVWLQSTYTPVLNGQGEFVRVIKYALDVTAEHTERVTTAGLVQALERSQAVIEFDLDGRVLRANDNFLAALGYTASEVVGQHHRMFVSAEEARSDAYRRFWQNLRAGHFDSGLYRRLGKHGREVWIQANYNPILDSLGRPIKVVKHATDVTRQIQAADVLRRSMASLASSVPWVSEQAVLTETEATHTQRQVGQSTQSLDELGGRMRQLEAQSRQLNAIVSSLDELAFHTNILSLNAAVQAAHAGAQGKGFAVVAQEVRRLAQQSAEASRQAHGLIESTLEAIEACSAQVQAMETITDETRNAASSTEQKVQQIVAAAAAQAQELGEARRVLAAW